MSVCFVKITVAQQNVLEKIKRRFTVLKAYPPNEKIVLITDRESYASGEIMWYTIFNLDPVSDTAINLSKVGYVEILDNTNQPVLQAKIVLDHGKGKGSFSIPTDLKTGYYTLRGYTNWMKNFSPEFYFEKNISITNLLRNESLTINTKREPIVNISTEGGSFLANVKSNIAIQVSDSSGAPLNYQGWLTGNNNDSLVNFAPNNNGLSILGFTPSAGQKYFAIFSLDDGTKITRALPDVLSSGTTLSIKDTIQNKLLVTINSSNAGDVFYLAVHDRNNIEYADKIVTNDGVANVPIDKNNLTNGVKNIVLFNEKVHALNERMIIVEKDLFSITASSDKKLYSKRQKVILDFRANKFYPNAMPFNVSLAVYRLDTPVTNSGIESVNDVIGSDDLRNRLLYNRFTSSISETDELNNMLLTLKWKWFNWNDSSYLKPGGIKYLPEYEGHIVSANLVDQKTRVRVPNTVGYLSVPGKAFHFYTSRSNSDGSINFFTKDLYGDNLIIAQGEPTANGNSSISILSPFSQEYSSGIKPAYAISAKLSAQQLQRSINVQLQKNFAYNKIVTDPVIIKDSLPFFGRETIQYALDDYVRFPTMEEVLREYVEELNVKKKKNEFSLAMVTRDPDGLAIIKHPAIFIDGVPVFDSGNKITHYDPLKIKTIKVLTDRYYYGPATFEGIASFTTYKGDLDGFMPDPNATVIDYPGLQLSRRFYSPVYETVAQQTSRIPDFRDLLFWNDDASLSDDGKGSVNFYTSDQTGTYKVVITALTKDGSIAETTLTFNVVN